MNRKIIQRISRKHQLTCSPKRQKAVSPIGADGQTKVAPNAVNRDFRRGANRRMLSTDIAYLPVKDGFDHLSAIIDCETDVVLAHATSASPEEKLVLDTYDQLKGVELPENVWACNVRGVRYTARAYREKLAELEIGQSMSRRACCWDNAPIESIWGRMKEQIGATDNLTHEQVVKLVDDHIDYYNNERGQPAWVGSPP